MDGFSWEGILLGRVCFGFWLLLWDGRIGWDGRFWGDGEGGARRVVELEMFCYEQTELFVGEGWGCWSGNTRVRFVRLLGKTVSVWTLNIRFEKYASYFT